MAKQYAAIITSKGQALIAAAIKGGTTISITEIAVGDGNGSTPVPTVGQTALVNETARVKLNALTIDAGNANHVIADGMIPAQTGGFWLREVGLFTADNVLIAVSALPPTYKPSAEEGATNSQRLLMTLIVSDVAAVNITVDNTTVMASESYVDDKITAHEKSRNHPDGTLKTKGFVQLSSTMDSTSETLASTPKAVKAANDNADSRLKAESNLSDLPDAKVSRDNLGLGELATEDSLTATDVGAVPTAGGDVGHLNNATHYAIKPGVWEGAGAFASQYADNIAPFMIPKGFVAARDASQYHPIIKGTVETQGFGYATAISFGVLTSGQGDFARGAIHAIGDNSTSQVWAFNPTDGDFSSPGDVVSGLNIVAGGGLYESGGAVRAFSPNNPPPYPVTSVNGQGGAVNIDVGYTPANPQPSQDLSPYAPTSWVYSSFVTGVSIGPRVTVWGTNSTSVPQGAVGITSETVNDDRVNQIVYAYVMYAINGNWVNAG
ncbi:MAG: phage tail protein [Ewingella sp.]